MLAAIALLAVIHSCLGRALPTAELDTALTSSLPSISTGALLAISPANSNCIDAPVAGECRTAAQAAIAIAQSFSDYNITSPWTQAALISLMVFESGDFKYHRNHYPGRPGQCCRNMQMLRFNVAYAQTITDAAFRSSLKTLNAAGSTSGANIDDDTARALCDLLADDRWSFGAAAWFVTTQCSPKINTALASQQEAGWTSWITTCIGTTVTEDRRLVWLRAVDAIVNV